MSETKNPGEKKLSVSGKTLTLKPRSETGTVRQSFSHGRSKQVVVEKVKRRVVGGRNQGGSPARSRSQEARRQGSCSAGRRPRRSAGRDRAQAESLQASCSAR